MLTAPDNAPVAFVKNAPTRDVLAIFAFEVGPAAVEDEEGDDEEAEDDEEEEEEEEEAEGAPLAEDPAFTARPVVAAPA